MAFYRYKAVTGQGKVVRGRMQADSPDGVVGNLQARGEIPLHVGAADAHGLQALPRWRRKTLSDTDRLRFTEQCATLLRAGLPLDQTLRMVAKSPASATARALVERIHEHVRGGQPLSQALAAERGVFPALYLATIEAGEAGGSLDTAFARLAGHHLRARRLREKVTGALVYPAFLLLGIVASLILLLAFVLPQFVPIFGDMGVALPWFTRALLDLGDFLHAWGWLLAALGVLAVTLGARNLRKPLLRRRVDAQLLRAKALGPLLLKLDTSRLLDTLGMLLGNGVSLLQALAIARRTVVNRHLSGQLEPAMQAVRDGSSLSRALASHTAFPELAVQIAAVGEQSGTLGESLARAAASMEADVHARIGKMLSALVPVLTILMAVMVAGIMLAILLPLLSLTGSIQ